MIIFCHTKDMKSFKPYSQPVVFPLVAFESCSESELSEGNRVYGSRKLEFSLYVWPVACMFMVEK